LKLFFREPESKRVVEVLAAQESVFVSDLGKLEAETQLRARRLGGLISKAKHTNLTNEMERVLALAPFQVLPFPDDGFARARALAARVAVHARTLDLLHMAAMDATSARHLFTNDVTQASFGRALGVVVLMPR
jgi:hypothetical protein